MSEASVTSAQAALATGPIKGRSLWDDARRRLLRNPAAVFSLGLLALLAFLATFGTDLDFGVFRIPGFWVHDVDMIFRDRVAIAPTWDNYHWLGTDTEGRDMMARLLFGLRISLLVGVVATAVALTIGVLWGAIAGFFGGWLDQAMMRLVDLFYSIPFIFFVILLMTAIPTNDPFEKIILIFIAIGAVEWLTMSRIVRGQTIALRQREFVEAARAAGASPLQIVTRHIVPNTLGPVVIFATLNIPVVILLESFLSFIGLGVQEPLTSLGQLISRGAQNMEAYPWLLWWPAGLMLLTLMALNFLGDGLRDALDPKDR
ncbi:MAG: ABC transporter permease subunit [Alphaproteobacteria bacterium]|jgi:oligopeptide transport system permease protein|nr:ABC transporter permease subunit [Alphaproteobacteria bacterium]